jgi:hypothetical protein
LFQYSAYNQRNNNHILHNVFLQKGGTFINEINNQSYDLNELTTNLQRWSANKQQKQQRLEPFTINGNTYTHLQKTDSFTNQNNEIFTIHELLKHEHKSIYTTYHQSMRYPNKKILLFSESTRRRIIRAAEHYNRPAPLTAETRFFQSIFDFLANYAESAYGFSQQYKSCLWACEYQKELAAAHYLYYGNAQVFKRNSRRIPMAGTSIHTITHISDGLHIKIHRPHTIQHRINEACRFMLLESLDCAKMGEPVNHNIMKAIGFQHFYYYENAYLSISPSYHQYVQAKINEYITELTTPTRKKDTPPPTINEPFDFIDNDEFDLLYENMLFDDLSDAQHQRNIDANELTLQKQLQEKLKDLSVNTVYTRKELEPYISKANFTSAPKYGFLNRVKRGFYIITEKLYADNNVILPDDIDDNYKLEF